MLDSNEEKELKTQFFNSLRENWTFEEELVKHLRSELEKYVNETLELLKLTHEVQCSLRASQNLPNFEIASPLSFTNLSSFFYALITNYSLSIVDSVFGIPNCENGIYSGNRYDLLFFTFEFVKLCNMSNCYYLILIKKFFSIFVHFCNAKFLHCTYL